MHELAKKVVGSRNMRRLSPTGLKQIADAVVCGRQEDFGSLEKASARVADRVAIADLDHYQHSGRRDNFLPLTLAIPVPSASAPKSSCQRHGYVRSWKKLKSLARLPFSAESGPRPKVC